MSVERKQLRIDPARRLNGATPKLHQYVRATDEQGYVETVAVEELDKESFLIWVHSRDSRVFVEDCMGHVLGYGALHFKSPLGAYPGPVPQVAETPDHSAVLALLDRWIEFWEKDIEAYNGNISPDGFAKWLQEQRDALVGPREPDCKRCGTGSGLCHRHAAEAEAQRETS